MSANRYQLRTVQQVYHLPTRSVTILGRGDHCTIMLDDDLVSREHAKIHVMSGAVQLVDCRSVNGTFVNERRVTKQCDLRSGDHIRIGFFDLTFEILQSQRSASPTQQLIFCRACQAALTAAMHFCVHCGEAVGEAKAQVGCFNCGAATIEGLTFCASCGHNHTGIA